MVMLSPLDDLLDLQDGVVGRAQVLLVAGESDATIRRRLRRREWVMLHPGVYVDHTGVPTWRQRAWAAVLYAQPAALAGVSALRAADGPGRRDHDDDAPIVVAVPAHRRVREQEGILIERRDDWAALVQQNLSPPRVRVEHAAVDAAAGAASDLAAMAILTEVVRSRRTTAERLLAVAEARTRLRRRGFIVGVLSDAASGAASVLEIEFLRNVERAHALPRALRQVRDVTSGLSLSSKRANVVYRDAALPALRLLIELDGRLGHSTSTDRDMDFERDLDAAAGEQATVRLGWGQAVVRPCLTALKLARIYRSRGWSGSFRPCPRCPEGLQVPGDNAA